MTRIRTNIYIDEKLKNEAMKRSDSLSRLIENLLRRYLSSERLEYDALLDQLEKKRDDVRMLEDAIERRRVEISNRAKAKEEIEKRVYRGFIKPARREKKPLGFIYKICSDDLGLPVGEVKKLGDEIFEVKGWSK